MTPQLEAWLTSLEEVSDRNKVNGTRVQNLALGFPKLLAIIRIQNEALGVIVKAMSEKGPRVIAHEALSAVDELVKS